MTERADVDPAPSVVDAEERRAKDLVDVACWLGVRSGVPVRLVDGFAFASGACLIVIVPAPEPSIDRESLEADAAVALQVLGWRCPTVRVDRPAHVHRKLTAHRQLSGMGRVETALRAARR